MKLIIDTSKQFVTTVSIQDNSTVIEKTVQSEARKSQNVLLLLETILLENKIVLSDLTEIIVSTGPGSFTGLRVGATVGSMLSLLLHIPLNGMEPGSNLQIEYGIDNWKLATS